MKIRCPKCHRRITVKRKAKTFPKHHVPEVHKTWAKITDDKRAVNNEGADHKDMIDIWELCPYSGAKFKVLWRTS